MKKRCLALLLALVMLLPMAAVTTAWAAESETYEVSDYTGTAPTKAGFVFAGWYTDNTFTTPYTEATGIATAKFVAQEVLSAKFQINSATSVDDESTRLRIVTTVDSLDYKKVGFIVQWAGEEARELTTSNVYRALTGYDGMAAYTYTPAEAFHSESQYFCAYNFTVPNSKFNTDFTVTPIWITKDGTTVHGVARTIRVSDGASFSTAATVTGSKPAGTWTAARVGNASIGPEKSYDGDVTTYWNPQATAGYPNGEGIVYTLDQAHTLTKAKLVFRSRMMWFALYTSPDGENWTQQASVTSSNQGDYYTSAESGGNTYYTCTVNSLNVADAGFVKLVFTGASDDSIYVVMSEAQFFGKIPMLNTTNLEAASVTVSGNQILGEWSNPRVDGGSLGPQLTYDGNTSTYWNPAAKSKYALGEGIAYTLGDAYTITGVSLTFSTVRYYFFNLLVSADGTDWTLARSVSPVNYAAFYETVDSTYVCTIDDLNASGVQYVKLLFTGSSTGGSNDWLTFYEIAFTALQEAQAPEEPDTRPVVSATITAHEQSGSWSNAGAANKEANKSYDGDESTPWNAAYQKDTSTIVYTLDNIYNLTDITLKFDRTTVYFNLSVSADGATWTPVASVTGSSGHYTGNTCAITDVDTPAARYIKMVFTINNGQWFNLYEIEASGKVVPDARETVAVSIESHEQSGSWSNAGATNKEADKSYDGDESTPWNAASTKDSSTIVYTLDDDYNLTDITLKFDRATMYFNVFVSADGTAWSQIATITGSSGHYTDNTCSITGLNTDAARYVKLVFTSNNGSWFNLYEITLLGKKVTV